MNLSGLRCLFSRVRKFKEFLGTRVWHLLFLAALVGALFFLAESSFIFVFQGFLRAVNLVDSSKLVLPKWYPQSLFSAVLIMVLFGLFRSLVYMIKFYVLGVTPQIFARRLRSMLLDYGLTMTGEVSSHELISIFTERVSQTQIFLGGLIQLAITFTSTALLVLIGIKIAPAEMLFGIFFLGLFLLPLKVLNSHYQSYGRVVVSEWKTVSQALVQGLKNNFFLRVYGLIPQEIEKGNSSLASVENHYKKYYLAAAFKNTMPLICGVIIISAITFISVTYLKTTSVKLIAFFYIFVRIAQGASELSGAASELRLHYPGFRLIYDWYVKILSERSIQESAKAATLSEAERNLFLGDIKQRGINISLEKMTFSYTDSNPLFQNFKLEIKKGDTLVIKGESGVGKSTLLTLILGLRSPSAGAIEINGMSVEKVRDLMSKLIAYVGPEAYLIAGTVRENLLYGNDAPYNVSDDEMWLALKKAQLYSEISSLPQKLNESLYELTQLSTGQKQRLAIARALLRKPKLLILDEASANLDAITESNFIGSLRDILIDLTTIIISHKSSFDSIASHKIELRRTFDHKGKEFIQEGALI